VIPVRFAVLARRDMEHIHAYYARIDPALGLRILDKIVAATAILQDHPRAGPVNAGGKRRKWRVAGTPYLLFYRVKPDEVRVLRVIHSAQALAWQ